MLQFFGTYNHKIDSKGRMALPSKFRKTYEKSIASSDLSSVELVVTTSPYKSDGQHNDCLYIFTAEDFNAWVDSFFEAVGGYNPRNKKHEMQRWALNANVEEVSIDSAGRINIPQKFRDKAAMESEVSVVGNCGRIEIWNTKQMEEKLEEIDLESLLYDEE